LSVHLLKIALKELLELHLKVEASVRDKKVSNRNLNKITVGAVSEKQSKWPPISISFPWIAQINQ